MRNEHRLLFSLFVVGFGCGGGGMASSTKPIVSKEAVVAVGTYPVTDLPGDLSCWMGKTTVELTNGTQAVSRTLMRQAWDASTSTLRSDTVSFAMATVQRGLAEYKVEGPTAKFNSTWRSGAQSGAISGVVTFTGEPGKWTAWSSEIEMPAGATKTVLKTKTTIGADKSATIEGNLFDGKGVQFAQSTGVLAALDAKTCKDEFSKAPPN